MPYAIRLAQINDATFGLAQGNTEWGFPVNTNFHTLLASYWMCGPTNSLGTAGIWPTFDATFFFRLVPGGTNGIQLATTLHAGSPFYEGGFSTPPPPGMLLHLMLSVDTHAQVVQLYINDRNVPITGSWIGTPPFDFNLGPPPGGVWYWNVSGVIATGLQPAMADAWIANPPSFVDLSVTANRRKFINADLTPVDLGATGTNPFGYQPAMYMSVRPGGVATDILNNLGVGGGSWNYSGPAAPTFQAPGTCTLPPPPPTPPPRLAIDNVICDATATQLEVNLISLRWSDDRGHSWGSPVTQDIGEAGEYRTSLQWQRCGYGRDRVWEISWSVPLRTALQGAFVDLTPASS